MVFGVLGSNDAISHASQDRSISDYGIIQLSVGAVPIEAIREIYTEHCVGEVEIVRVRCGRSNFWLHRTLLEPTTQYTLAVTNTPPAHPSIHQSIQSLISYDPRSDKDPDCHL